VTIADAHLTTSSVTLNGQAYVSGTSIASSGNYTLAASASDAAGNTSSASVHFTLDLDAPTIVFTSPAANATVGTSAIEVIGQTEALAHVHLSTAGFSVDTDADAAGEFDVTGVPLIAGANTITAHATDGAGNVGPNAAVVVTYQTVGLTGSLAGLPAQIARGLTLDVPYTLHNTGTVEFVALPLRVELRPAAGGAVVLTDDFASDIASGADTDGARELATTPLPPGDYAVVLSANLPAIPGPSGWITLDTANTRVFADLCRRGSNDVIFADGFEGGASPSSDEIFCNGFEQLLAKTAQAKVLGIDGDTVGAALWATLSDVLPVVRAVGKRARVEFASAIANAQAQRNAAIADPAWHRAYPRMQRSQYLRVATTELASGATRATHVGSTAGLLARELP
jgi:hypothetical protein